MDSHAHSRLVLQSTLRLSSARSTKVMTSAWNVIGVAALDACLGMNLIGEGDAR